MVQKIHSQGVIWVPSMVACQKKMTTQLSSMKMSMDKVTYLSITIVTWGFEIRNKRNSGTIVTVQTRMSRVESHSQRTDVKESFPLESVSDVFAVSFHLMVPVSKRQIIILKVLHVTKLYIPSTLNIDLILWHTQLNVCAVKC